MREANPIRTLGDYSKPSHEGYRNTIKLHKRNNMVPLRSDTIRLTTIEKLAQYEEEGWNDPIIPEEGNLDYKNPDIEHVLGVMEYKVDTLMKDAILLIGGSKSIFRMTSNETYRPPPEPSCKKKFEHIMKNFILDQEERVRELKEYMKVIVSDFMLLTNEMMGALIVEPFLHVFKKKSLISMGVVMELHNRACFWPAGREVEEEDEEDNEANEEAGGDVGNEGARGSADMYRNMS
nr:zinc finger, CCHC-type [Tanacetum cinerariifolium]